MSRPIKEKMVKQYAARFEGVSGLAVVRTQGLDVQRMTALRGTLRSRGLRAMVVRNSLCRRALTMAGLERAGELLDGPCTLIWGGASIVDLAKAIAEQAKTVAEIKVCGGYLEGRLLSAEDLAALSKMPGREELLGRIVALAGSQGARLAALVMAPAGRILSQVRKRAEGAAEAAAAAEAPAAAEAAAAAEAPAAAEASAAKAPEAPAVPAAPAGEAKPAEGSPPAAEAAAAAEAPAAAEAAAKTAEAPAAPAADAPSAAEAAAAAEAPAAAEAAAKTAEAPAAPAAPAGEAKPAEGPPPAEGTPPGTPEGETRA